MKTFKELREAKKLKGEVVFKKKMNKIEVVITKDNKGFTAYVDGDRLDTFRSQAEAEKAAQTVIKELT